MTTSERPAGGVQSVPENGEADHLRFAPETLAHLGERLVPGMEQAIIELVKNSYDADARTCTVRISAGSSSISISDDGVGMSQADIRDGWLVLGRSGKAAPTPSTKFSRLPVGDKGLGRLSALRLGRTATIHTRPEKEPGIEYRLCLDWDEFAAARTVEEVDLYIERTTTTDQPGTDIYVEELRTPVLRGDVGKLARGLILLSDPFQSDTGFAAILEAEEFADLERRVRNAYFEDADYRIEATLSEDGTARASILDWKGDPLVPEEELGDGPFETVPATFQLWAFPLGTGAFSTRQARRSEIRPWLKVVGGVHVYEGPIRVPPYGDDGVDWLDMNLRRVRSPEARPSTNNSVGRIVLDNAGRRLVQKTDRVGYIASHEFNEIVRFGHKVLDWAARKTLDQLEAKRDRTRQEIQAEQDAIQTKIEEAAAKVPLPQRAVFDKAVQQVVAATDRRVKHLQDDLQLYRSLATAGMASAVFSHEIGKPLGMVTRNLDLIEDQVAPENKFEAKGIFDLVRAAAERLTAYVDLPMSLLRKDKRRIGQIDLIATIRGAVGLFSPIVAGADITVELDVPREKLSLRGSVALIEGVLANLISNSISAFQRDGISPPKRLIRLRVVPSDDHRTARISFVDNAGGLIGISSNEIWLPGATTREDGTGFGLTIVRDSVHDLGGSISVQAVTDFGGAEFLVTLPVSGQR